MTTSPWIAVLTGAPPPRWAADAVRRYAAVAGPPAAVLLRPRAGGWPDVPALRPDADEMPGPAPHAVDDPIAALRQHPGVRSIWLGGAPPSQACSGAWWVGFGAPGETLGATPGLPQIVRGTACSSAALVTFESACASVLVEAVVRTVDVSVPRQIERLLAVAAELPARAHHVTASRGMARVSTGAPDWHGWIGAATRRARLKYAARQVDETLRADVWNVGVIDAPIERMLDPGFRPRVRWLPEPPQGTFIADPFAVQRDGGIRVYAEALDLVEDIGAIVSADLDRDGTCGPWRERLRLPTHLSYPAPLSVDGEQFIIPESAATRTVTAWRVGDDGNLYDPTVVLQGFAALDPTLVEHAGRWWLFATDADREPVNALHVWHAEHPFGPWTPHAGNPVKVDVRTTRPAGTPFIVDGVLYRPTQDCSTGYGAAVCIERVHTLTPDAFEEHTVRRLSPDAERPQGIHTLSAAGDLTVVDGSRRVVAPRRAARELARKLERLRS